MTLFQIEEGDFSPTVVEDSDKEDVLRFLAQSSFSAATTLASSLTLPFHHVTKLDLPGCQLTAIPAMLPDALPNLSILFLSNNCFETLPAVIGRCKLLQIVAFKSNRMKNIDAEALQSQLRWLILTDNQITTLPSTICRCVRLQKLMLSGNQLSSLPSEMVSCQNIELIRLASNKLSAPPMDLLQSLGKLTWVGLSDNPFLPNASSLSASSMLTVLEDVSETDGEVLGEGAGGIVRKVWVESLQQYAAIKIASGNITSDGLPFHEKIISCFLNGASPAFTRVLGVSSPSNALVLEYLDNFTALASPPSFESCSRDVYDKNILFSVDQAVTVIGIVLEATTELHRRGVCHGDLYGHNILVCRSDYSSVRLTDFGAAFRYDQRAPYGTLIEQIELRAFTVLVDEIMNHVVRPECTTPSSDDNHNSNSTLLSDFRRVCQDTVKKGHGFDVLIVWWKQQRLRNLSAALEHELDLEPL